MIFKKIIIIAVLVLSAFSFSACEPKGTAEKAGESIDQVMQDTADKVGEVTGAIKEKAEDVTKAVQEKTE